ncbi:adipocyte plasma membrane-associated protein [Elysia marginata]|uniref:Adipocyte plasma membrane-associated protein n=1 Tax=Elysia marginata TaxID=1093978 RepID=A0AAV4J385_9GAST|nr:adipocyte plasma membrane-associated protein [Elysia marginata]
MLFFYICLVVAVPIFASDIQPVLYDLGPVPSLTGALEENSYLTQADRFKVNQVVGAVSFVFHRDHIYTGLANGQIVDVSDCGVKLIASLAPQGCRGELQCGRPVGLRMDRQGRLIVADAYRGIFRINVQTGDDIVGGLVALNGAQVDDIVGGLLALNGAQVDDIVGGLLALNGVQADDIVGGLVALNGVQADDIVGGLVALKGK